MFPRSPDLDHLENRYGIFLRDAVDFTDSNAALAAMDAQPVMSVPFSSGLPSMFTTYVDRDVTRAYYAPTVATTILGEERKLGTWEDDTITFGIIDGAGEVSSYGDFNRNGSNAVNEAWINRQPYYYQTMSRWGERAMARFSRSGLNYKNEIDLRSADTLNRFQNKTYFFGVAGLLNYGLLNDPSLPAALTPSVKAAGGTSWDNATPNEVYSDCQTLIRQLIGQTRNMLNTRSPITLAMSGEKAVALTNSNSFTASAEDLLKKNFPGLTIETAPEYNTAGGQLVQAIAKSLNGNKVGFTSFTEKVRLHQVVPDPSGTAWNQKKSQGTNGAIIKQPTGYSQMIGI